MSPSSFILHPSSFYLGLIGYPLGHSLSPKIHAAALNACNLQGNYSLFPIYPEDKLGLKELLSRVRAGEITGLNVTIPHKQNVIELMDELTPTAQAIGAVNTIYLREKKLIGDNTDAAGFLSDLKKFIGNRELGVGKSAIVLGTGGAARAVIYALINDGWNITITSRRVDHAQQLINSFPDYELRYETIDPSTMFKESLQLLNFQLIVNATPVGMAPKINEAPLPENTIFDKRTFIYDLVYNPRETKLVRDARAQGLQATTGLGMLIEQAALAFELWTGHNPPREVLFESVRATRPD